MVINVNSESEVYKLCRKHQVEIFDMIYDVYQRAPKQDPISVLFGYDTEEEKEEFDKKMEEYLNLEKPKIIERFKELGFNITLK